MECMMEMSEMGKIARMSVRAAASGKKLGIRAVFPFFPRNGEVKSLRITKKISALHVLKKMRGKGGEVKGSSVRPCFPEKKGGSREKKFFSTFSLSLTVFPLPPSRRRF